MTAQQTPYPQTAQRPSPAGAIVTLVIGAVLTVFGPILGILIGSFALVPQALGLADNTAHVAPTATVELDAGESVFLLAPVADLEAIDHSACTAWFCCGPASDRRRRWPASSGSPSRARRSICGCCGRSGWSRIAGPESSVCTVWTRADCGRSTSGPVASSSSGTTASTDWMRTCKNSHGKGRGAADERDRTRGTGTGRAGRP